MWGAALACWVWLLAGPAAVSAQSSVYSWTDEKGTVHFSNTGPPRDGADNVKKRFMRPHVARDSPPGSREIPFVILGGDDTRRFVLVVLEGARTRKEVLMLVDTGAQLTLIDEELAGDLDVEHVQDARIVGVSGSAPAWVGRLRSLRVGEDEVRQPHVMVGPRTGMLLLGMDVLSALNLTIGPTALERE